VAYEGMKSTYGRSQWWIVVKTVQPSAKAVQLSGSKRREEFFYFLSNCYILFLLSLECLTISRRRSFEFLA
jgi:hypothetical protein